jgi:hypothetical protein
MSSEIKIIPPRTGDPVEIARFYRSICNILNALLTVQTDSVATNVTEIVTDFNSFLQSFRDITADTL